MRLGSTARIVAGLAAGVLLMGGVFGLLAGVGSLVDPGFQMSNDDDPFAAPPTMESSLSVTIAGACAFLLGGGLAVWLARKS